jgi:DNA-binding CsgD family transcriptional regulator
MMPDEPANTKVRKPTILNDIDISPTATLFLAVLYLGGVVYGIYMKMMLAQPWLVSLPNLATIGVIILLSALVITDRAPFTWLFHAACLSGFAIFALNGAWWHFADQPNSLLVVNVSVCFAMLFGFLLIMAGTAWCGFAILAASLVLYTVESVQMNHRYPLCFLGLVLPAAIAFGITLFMIRRSLEMKLAQRTAPAHDRPILDLRALGLSDQELRCLDYLADNLSSKEMAMRENVSVSAIHNRFSILYRKLHAVDRHHLRMLLLNHEIRK